MTPSRAYFIVLHADGQATCPKGQALGPWRVRQFGKKWNVRGQAALFSWTAVLDWPPPQGDQSPLYILAVQDAQTALPPPRPKPIKENNTDLLDLVPSDDPGPLPDDRLEDDEAEFYLPSTTSLPEDPDEGRWVEVPYEPDDRLYEDPS